MNRLRIDGLLKVTGAKLYARDLRPGDVPGVRRRLGLVGAAEDDESWPRPLYHVLLLRARYVDRQFAGLNSAAWPAHLRPASIVVDSDLAARKIGLVEKAKFGNWWLVPIGKVPEHYGQPLAICYFEEITTLRDARAWLRQGGFTQVVHHGAITGPYAEQDIRRRLDPLLGAAPRRPAGDYGSTHYVKRESSDPALAFSHFGTTTKGHDPAAINPAGFPATPDGQMQLATNRRARDAAESIARLAAENGWTTFDRTFFTQTTDPVFFEPEAGLAWWQEGTATLHLAQATQSRDKDRDNIRTVLKQVLADRALGWRHTPCYPGGAFGGRDESSFPVYLALAALFANRPVRIAFDRFEQFDAGIKACAAVVRNRLACDASFRPQALFCDAVFDGGGESTLAMAVVGLGALQSTGIYNIPHVVISATGMRTAGAPAGSLRGFGIPQVTFAIESMIDEIAGLAIAAGASPAQDAIHFRQLHAMRNPLDAADPLPVDAAGCTLPHHLGNVEICRQARQHRLWVSREVEKTRRSHDGLAYGVGFAACMESFGTNRDAIFIEVGIEPDGSIVIRSCATDMGQGSATSLAIAARTAFGRDATRVVMGESDYFDALGITVRAAGVTPELDPRYSPKVVSAMSASMFAFYHLHALDEACAVVVDHGVLPAACDLWQLPAGAVAREQTEWVEGGLRLLVVPDGAPEASRRLLMLPELAARMHARGDVTAAMVHTYYQVRFARAKFALDQSPTAPDGRWRHIDGLLIRRGARAERLDRSVVEYPPPQATRFPRSLYASAAHVIAVEVNLRSGSIDVVDAVTFLDPGTVHHQDLLLGQAEGGFAQGVSHALIEELPPPPEGADGWWNLHRYPITAARHLRRIPGGRPEVVLIGLGQRGILNVPPDAPLVSKKGIAEAVLTPVPAAVHNAIAHATGGVRLSSLPMRAADLRQALAERARHPTS